MVLFFIQLRISLKKNLFELFNFILFLIFLEWLLDFFSIYTFVSSSISW